MSLFKSESRGLGSSCSPNLMLFLALLLAVVLLLMPLSLGISLGSQALENAAHAPLFAVVALLALRARRHARPGMVLTLKDYLVVWGLMVLFGALTEIAQGFTGRDPSLEDLANDALGAALALAGTACLRREQFVTARPACWIVPALIAVGALLYAAPPLWSAAAYAQRWIQRPVLWQWRTPLDDYFISHAGTQVYRIPAAACLSDPATPMPAGQALWIALDSGRYPGLWLDEPYPDWRGYRTLLIDLANPGAEPVPLTLRVHDARHNYHYDDRYNETFELPPRQRTRLQIALRDIERAPRGRPLDLARVAGLMIFRAEPAASAAICLLSIQLER